MTVTIIMIMMMTPMMMKKKINAPVHGKDTNYKLIKSDAGIAK